MFKRVSMQQYIVKRDNFIQQDVDGLVEAGFSESFARVLATRGVNVGNLESFLGEGKYNDPFLMQGMVDAVAAVKAAAVGGGKILIYGDYDADGLTASSLLSLFFTRNGIANDVVIPEREDGYGMHTHLVKPLLDSGNYSLLITVDCGISNADVVDELHGLYPDLKIVVTDHHEVPTTIPDCVCVNPKLGNYPFRYLSGSGVAYKLVQAIAGTEQAIDYADIAMIGTIADIMPLCDENRTIVKHGLANFNHKGLKLLAEKSKCSKPITATDIAMRIGPRINASGRVSSPLTALQVLLSADRADSDAVESLCQLNDKRKEILDEIVAKAEKQCDDKKISSDRLVYLYGEDWQHGLLGIVANKFRERYNLPAVVMTREGDNYVGSARGVDGVDLHSLFVQSEDLLVRFGGHNASVGFTVSAENLVSLQRRLSGLLVEMPADCFDKKLYYDLDVDGTFTYSDVLKLSDMLQPMLPSDGIVLHVKNYVKYANSFGKDGSHISFTMADGLQLKGFFSYSKYLEALKTGAEVSALCTLEYSAYDNDIIGIVSAIDLLPSLHFENLYDIIYARNIDCQQGSKCECGAQNLNELLRSSSIAVVFDTYNQYLKHCDGFHDLPVRFFHAGADDRCVVISPDEDLSIFDNVVVFTDKESVRRYSDNAVYVFIDKIQRPTLNRQLCALVYKSLTAKGKFDCVIGLYNKFLLEKMTLAQYISAVKVFEQLNLISTDYQYSLEIFHCKVNLEDSAVFNYLKN